MTAAAADLSAARDHLRRTLPETLQAALDGYDAFAARPVPDDAKEFAAWQSGCKAALGHVELLLKLAARVGLDLSDGANQGAGFTNLSALAARAQAALDQDEDNEDADD